MIKWILAVILLTPVAALAQPADPYQPLTPLRVGESLINLPTPRVIRPGTWEVRFTHRFIEPINEGDEHSFWGLDSSADIGLGLAWAPAPNLQFSIVRTDLQDTFEGAVKYVVVQQAPAFPFSASIRGGVDWLTEVDIDERVAPFAQLILSRQITPRLEVFALPTYALNAGPFDSAFNVPVGLAWMWRKPSVSLILEVIPENGDSPEEEKSGIAWAVGLKRAMGGHYFEILLSDTRATHVNHYVTSGASIGGIDTGDIHLGFNIERRFGGRRR